MDVPKKRKGAKGIMMADLFFSRPHFAKPLNAKHDKIVETLTFLELTAMELK